MHHGAKPLVKKFRYEPTEEWEYPDGKKPVKKPKPLDRTHFLVKVLTDHAEVKSKQYREKLAEERRKSDKLGVGSLASVGGVGDSPTKRRAEAEQKQSHFFMFKQARLQGNEQLEIKGMTSNVEMARFKSSVDSDAAKVYRIEAENECKLLAC